MAKKRMADIRAAGGVVWRFRDGAVQIALVHRPRYDDWSLPKGKLEPGETELQAAVREVGEEIGAEVAVSRRLDPITYQVDGSSKSVAFWVMQHTGGDFEANDEVDEIAWLTPPQARRTLHYADEQSVLDDFLAAPLPESVVVLVRHAKAGKRSEWKGDDAKRPLDTAGRAQARRLGRFLVPFAADRVVSARPLRCVQTVQPLADQLDLNVTIDEAFDDETFERRPEVAEAALVALAKPRRVTIVASQGSAIPGLVDAVVPGLASSSARKGAAWVLAFADGTVVSADYYDEAAR